MQNAELIKKIERLPPDRIAEVEDFVDHIANFAENSEKAGAGNVNLRALGISEEDAAVQRAALITFAEDWEDPSMDVYDELKTR